MSCLSFEKIISIGFRSGLYGGSKTTCAPADSITRRALSDLRLPRLSITTRSPGFRAGTRNDSQNPVKQTPSIGPSSTIAARVLSSAMACTSVLVSQRPVGTDSTSRSPPKAQSRRRVNFFQTGFIKKHASLRVYVRLTLKPVRAFGSDVFAILLSRSLRFVSKRAFRRFKKTPKGFDSTCQAKRSFAFLESCIRILSKVVCQSLFRFLQQFFGAF